MKNTMPSNAGHFFASLARRASAPARQEHEQQQPQMQQRQHQQPRWQQRATPAQG